MKILAFDTSSASGSIALTVGDRLVGETTVGSVGVHAEWLMESIDGFLKGLATSIHEVDLFALTTGPGSFTGLRIGVSTVKGLAWALRKPVVGVSTLEALAMNLPYSSAPVCPVLDARKREVYAAVFTPAGSRCERIVEDCAVTPQRLFEILSSAVDGPVVFLGNGLELYADDIKGKVKGAILAPRHLWYVRASNIARIAYRSRYSAAGAERISPVYRRKSEAELKKDAPKKSR